jgi:hypothetical protein
MIIDSIARRIQRSAQLIFPLPEPALIRRLQLLFGGLVIGDDFIEEFDLILVHHFLQA